MAGTNYSLAKTPVENLKGILIEAGYPAAELEASGGATITNIAENTGADKDTLNSTIELVLSDELAERVNGEITLTKDDQGRNVAKHAFNRVDLLAGLGNAKATPVSIEESSDAALNESTIKSILAATFSIQDGTFDLSGLTNVKVGYEATASDELQPKGEFTKVALPSTLFVRKKLDLSKPDNKTAATVKFIKEITVPSGLGDLTMSYLDNALLADVTNALNGVHDAAFNAERIAYINKAYKNDGSLKFAEDTDATAAMNTQSGETPNPYQYIVYKRNQAAFNTVDNIINDVKQVVIKRDATDVIDEVIAQKEDFKATGENADLTKGTVHVTGNESETIDALLITSDDIKDMDSAKAAVEALWNKLSTEAKLDKVFEVAAEAGAYYDHSSYTVKVTVKESLSDLVHGVFCIVGEWKPEEVVLKPELSGFAGVDGIQA